MKFWMELFWVIFSPGFRLANVIRRGGGGEEENRGKVLD